MFGKSGKDLLIENTKLEVRVEMLNEEIKRLREENNNLQKALLARVSPDAYADIISKEYDKNFKEDKEVEFLKAYANQIEKPLFTDTDDMLTKLTGLMGTKSPEPIHENNES